MCELLTGRVFNETAYRLVVYPVVNLQLLSFMSRVFTRCEELGREVNKAGMGAA